MPTFDDFNVEDRTIDIPEEFEDIEGALDASRIADGSVGNTEFQHLSGIESNIQDQLDAAGESLSDADIGSKAFNNSPSDLTDAKKLEVRTAIGASENAPDAIAGLQPQSITGTVVSGLINAGGGRNITVTGVGSGSYFSQGAGTNSDRILMTYSGVYRLYGKITFTGNNRTGPGFIVSGTGVNILGHTNVYHRDADSEFTVDRFVDFYVENPSTLIRLQVRNYDLTAGNIGTDPLTLDDIDGLCIIPIGGRDVGTAETSVGLTVQEEGTALTTEATTINFVGPNVTATGTGATKTITIGASDVREAISPTSLGNYVRGSTVASGAFLLSTGTLEVHNTDADGTDQSGALSGISQGDTIRVGLSNTFTVSAITSSSVAHSFTGTLAYGAATAASDTTASALTYYKLNWSDWRELFYLTMKSLAGA